MVLIIMSQKYCSEFLIICVFGFIQQYAEKGGPEFFFVINIQVSMTSLDYHIQYSSSLLNIGLLTVYHCHGSDARKPHVFHCTLLHDENSFGRLSLTAELC